MANDITPVVSFSKGDITTDITGQLAVSERSVTQSFIFTQTDHQLFVSRQTATGGTVALDTAKAALVLSTTTTSGSTAVIETKKVVQYLVGQAHTISCSLTVGAVANNCRKRWGVFSDTNGFYFEQTGSGLSVVARSNISGSTVNTVVTQANFNIDKADGTGPSGFNLDLTKNAVFVIEYTWHGAGRVRFGIKANKDKVYLHEFDFDNSQAFPYSRNPYQPIKFEITNTGTTAAAQSLHVHAIGSWVHNADKETPNVIFTADRGTSRKDMTNSVTRPLLAIRPKLTFNGRINRVNIEPISVGFVALERTTLVQVILNPDTITGASWADVNPFSAVEFDTAATAYTGGTVIQSFYVNAATNLVTGTVSGSNVTQIGSFPLGLSIDGTTQDVLLIAARTTDGNSLSLANVNWKEFQ